jgi:hypothetical protein
VLLFMDYKDGIRMNLTKLFRAATGVLIAGLFFTASAHAYNLTWTINDHVFDDGHYLTGSFDYDADIGVFSNINITSHSEFDFTYTDSNVNPVQYYDGTNPTDPIYPYGSFVVLANVPDELHKISFTLSGQLTNNGGTISLVDDPYGTSEDVCFDDGDPRTDCFTPGETHYAGAFGTGTISAVPVPAAVWLFGSALAGLGWFRRRTA